MQNRSLNSIIFIGDPQITFRRPARRLDEDFLAVCLDKLDQAISLCNEYNAQPVILGDLFEYACEPNSRKASEMLTGLSHVLSKAIHKPYVVAGNHDIKETTVTSDTHLSVMESANLIEILDQGVRRFALAHESKVLHVALSAVPYGNPLPDYVDRVEKDDIYFMVTHHDLEFEDSYPNAIPLHEISGVDHAVNGHMHLRQKSIRAGQTNWHNPGNIIRQTIDDKDHIPNVLLFDGNDLKSISLKYEPKEIVIDQSGYQIEKEETVYEEGYSEFVKALESTEDDREQSEDAGHIKQTIRNYFNEKEICAQHQNVIWDLLERQLA